MSEPDKQDISIFTNDIISAIPDEVITKNGLENTVKPV